MRATTKATTPRVIPTRYKGIKFRSRLEARWAVFFDHIGCTWEYEPEWFELSGGGAYLPDFRLDGRVWAEVKPPRGNISKPLAFAAEALIIVLAGPPGTNDNVFRVLGQRYGNPGDGVVTFDEWVSIDCNSDDRFFWFSYCNDTEAVADRFGHTCYHRSKRCAPCAADHANSERFGS